MGLLVDRNTPPVAIKFGNFPDDEQEVNTVFVKAKFSLGDTIQIEEASYRMELAQGDGAADDAQAFRVPVSSIGQMLAALLFYWRAYGAGLLGVATVRLN